MLSFLTGAFIVSLITLKVDILGYAVIDGAPLYQTALGVGLAQGFFLRSFLWRGVV
jgi:hypothetical protein